MQPNATLALSTAAHRSGHETVPGYEARLPLPVFCADTWKDGHLAGAPRGEVTAKSAAFTGAKPVVGYVVGLREGMKGSFTYVPSARLEFPKAA
jgi:hypothetical protein